MQLFQDKNVLKKRFISYSSVINITFLSYILYVKNLKIPTHNLKRKSKITDNTMAKRKRTNYYLQNPTQKQKIEQHAHD